ncbi:pentatricopeptide repeat (PPR) superfamily protein [Tasmannia lanceolata]|uniref:pentatricopeptide repeat (PPR) superfamily protein n=1 Tax=Tasmannia lanceolata TaxID=3420 RepID=UPI004064048C
MFVYIVKFLYYVQNCNFKPSCSWMISRLPTNSSRVLYHSSFNPRFSILLHEKIHLLLKACSGTPSSGPTKSLHALLIISGSHKSIFFNNNLVNTYASIGELSLAKKLFDKMPQRNTVSYNSIIAACKRHGNGEEGWQLFSEMMASGLKPTQFTFGSILSSPSLDHRRGFQIQPLILKMGLLYVDAFSGTALLGLFGRNGCLDDALKLFEEMSQRSVVTWNSIISAFSQHELVDDSIVLFRELLRTEIRPTEYSFLGILSAFRSAFDCKSGEQIHGLVIKTGTEFYVSVANALVDMYAKCLDIFVAEKLFYEMPIRDVISWNLMIAAFTNCERPEKALELFLTMSVYEIPPSQTTFASIVSSCTRLKTLSYGKFIHAKTIKNSLKSDVFVGTALVDFYVKCNRLEDAHLSFDEITDKNVVSWNTLISGYSTAGSRSSVYLLEKMLHSGFQPNEFSFSAVLKTSLVPELQQLHSLITRMGYNHNEYVSNSIAVSYANNGLISDALKFTIVSSPPLSVFNINTIAMIYNRNGLYQNTKKIISQLQEPDIISWNILIEACARNGDYKEAFKLLKDMQTAQLLPDNCTFVSLTSICSKLCNLALGSAVHALIIKTDFRRRDVFLCNVLVDMYAKCGNLESSIKIFDEMTERNLISWTAVISALGLHGYPYEALKRFKEMESLGFKPDTVALIVILSACSHGGLVEEGMQLFERMQGAYGIEPEMDHYVCVVGMLCRNDRLKEVERLISSMPFQPNAVIWRTFLEGCRRSSDTARYKSDEARMLTQPNSNGLSLF